MAKSLLMRPSWVCLKLCEADTISATVLAEILFRANVTKFENNGNPIVVFSLEEWADLIGMSINQIRKALKRLTDLRVIRAYNKPHPFKGVLRALHVEVPEELAELHHYLTSGGYRFENDVLCLSTDGLSTIRLSTSNLCKMTAHCTITMSGDNGPVCAQGTQPHIYNNKNKEEIVAAKNADNTALQDSKEKEDEEGIPASLKSIPTLLTLVMELHDHYLKYHAEKLSHWDKPDFNAHHAGKLWAYVQDQHLTIYAQKKLSPKDYALLKIMVGEFQKETLIKIIEGAVTDWHNFTQCVLDRESVWQVPAAPDVGFLFYFRKHAVHMYVSKLASYSVAKDKKQPELKEATNNILQKWKQENKPEKQG